MLETRSRLKTKACKAKVGASGLTLPYTLNGCGLRACRRHRILIITKMQPVLTNKKKTTVVIVLAL